MSFKPYTEKINKKKKWNLVGSGSRTRPGSGSIIPEADPRIRIRIKMIRIRIRIKMIRIRKTALNFIISCLSCFSYTFRLNNLIGDVSLRLFGQRWRIILEENEVCPQLMDTLVHYLFAGHAWKLNLVQINFLYVMLLAKPKINNIY